MLIFTLRTSFCLLFCTCELSGHSCARMSSYPLDYSFPCDHFHRFYFSSMDSNHLYCINHDLIIFYLKRNVPRDPSAKIRYTGENPGRYRKWYQSDGLALGKQMNITKGKIGNKSPYLGKMNFKLFKFYLFICCSMTKY